MKRNPSKKSKRLVSRLQRETKTSEATDASPFLLTESKPQSHPTPSANRNALQTFESGIHQTPPKSEMFKIHQFAINCVDEAFRTISVDHLEYALTTHPEWFKSFKERDIEACQSHLQCIIHFLCKTQKKESIGIDDFDFKSAFEYLKKLEASTFSQQGFTFDVFCDAIRHNPAIMSSLHNRDSVETHIDNLIIAMVTLSMGRKEAAL